MGCVSREVTRFLDMGPYLLWRVVKYELVGLYTVNSKLQKSWNILIPIPQKGILKGIPAYIIPTFWSFLSGISGVYKGSPFQGPY